MWKRWETALKKTTLEYANIPSHPMGSIWLGMGMELLQFRREKKKKQLKIALNEINFSTAWKVQAQSILWIIQC